jgi:hypothetical protein
MLIFSQT